MSPHRTYMGIFVLQTRKTCNFTRTKLSPVLLNQYMRNASVRFTSRNLLSLQQLGEAYFTNGETTKVSKNHKKIQVSYSSITIRLDIQIFLISARTYPDTARTLHGPDHFTIKMLYTYSQQNKHQAHARQSYKAALNFLSSSTTITRIICTLFLPKSQGKLSTAQITLAVTHSILKLCVLLCFVYPRQQATMQKG